MGHPTGADLNSVIARWFVFASVGMGCSNANFSAQLSSTPKLYGEVAQTTRKNNKKGNESESNENFVSCLGALKIIKHGWETEAIPKLVNKNRQKLGFFAKFFENKS